MRRIFLDANVLFAAAISESGRSAALFLLASRGQCVLVTSPHAAAEARRNLEARYPEAIGRFTRLLLDVVVAPEATPSAVAWARDQGLPDEDAPILGAALAAHADVLVTGDRTHFGRLFGRTVGGVQVLSLAETLERILGGRS